MNELGKDYKGGGNILIPLGIGMLIYSYFYDSYNGVKIIEQKRHAVRFKYGKQLKFSLRPQVDLFSHKAAINFSLYF